MQSVDLMKLAKKQWSWPNNNSCQGATLNLRGVVKEQLQKSFEIYCVGVADQWWCCECLGARCFFLVLKSVGQDAWLD